MIENAKINSINNDKTEIKRRVVSIKSKTLSALLITFLTLSLTGCGLSNELSYGQEANYVMSGYTSQVLNELNSNNLEYILKARDKEVFDNTVEDYKKLDSLSEEKLIGFYNCLGEQECEKVLIALGYEGWNDFLIKKGHLDENGKPSVSVWEDSVRDTIKQDLKEKGGKTK